MISAAVDSDQNVYTLQGVEGAPYDCNADDPSVVVYAAHAYGKRTKILATFPVRAPAEIGGGLYCDAYVAVDGKRDIYVASTDVVVGQWVGAWIREYAVTAKGKGRVIRTILFKVNSSPVTMIGGMSGDSGGNLYALLNSNIVEFAAGSQQYRSIVSGYQITTFAVDSRSYIYALVGTTNPPPIPYSIDVFAPGSSAPISVIAGSATGLVNVGSIAVSP
jgi:hypothetical protein